jgi:hypothetical protein
MNTRLRKAAWISAICLGAALATPAVAQTTCGVTATANATQSVQYDPFSANGLSQVSIPLTLTRVTGTGGKKTQQVNFVFTQPPGSPNYTVTYNGASILYTEGQTQGHPTLNSQASGEINFNFGGAAAPDTVTLQIPIVVTVPANTDLSAGDPIRFDMFYVCDGTGGLQNVTTPQTQRNVVQINVNVRSGLQASYAGPSLDFGEVGDKTDAEVAATTLSGRIRVASSGAYTISLASANGYSMTYDATKAGNEADNLRYQVAFLGDARSPTNNGSLSRTCVRAGLGSPPLSAGRDHALSVRLLEGGQAETPSTGYSDTLTVTVTPLAAGTAGTACTVANPF